MVEGFFAGPVVLSGDLGQKGGLIVSSLVVGLYDDTVLSHLPVQGLLTLLKVHEERNSDIQKLHLLHLNRIKPIVLQS